MKDTSRDIEQIYRQMIMSKSDRERFMMGMEMIQDGYDLMVAGIKNQYPGISEKEIRLEILKRLRASDPSLAWLDPLLQNHSIA
jgi:hypothetical protein